MTPSWLGRVEYGAALRIQERARLEARSGGGARVFGLEHPPVLTLGKRGGVVSPDAGAAGFAVWRTRRGGLATCHEPGQLVGYLVMDARQTGVRRLVETVEACILDFLGSRGVAATRRTAYPGVWVEGSGGWAKIAAVGMQIRDGWTTHGFALNLRNDLRGFGLIDPCGIQDASVTSLLRLRGAAPSPRDAFAELGPALGSALGCAPIAIPPLTGEGTHDT